MGREIKLRAYDKVNKEFVYVTITQGAQVIEAVVKGGGQLEPWQQWTGLKDKNGVDIYEGDKMFFATKYGRADGSAYGQVIEFHNGCFLLDGMVINANNFELGWLAVKENIYENQKACTCCYQGLCDAE